VQKLKKARVLNGEIYSGIDHHIENKNLAAIAVFMNPECTAYLRELASEMGEFSSGIWVENWTDWKKISCLSRIRIGGAGRIDPADRDENQWAQDPGTDAVGGRI
jgi:hypothetical protein